MLCSAHSLKLVLCHYCSVQSVRNCMGTVKATITFFRSSAKRTAHLKRVISEQLSSSLSILGLHETRWIEKHYAMLLFIDHMYKALVISLEDLRDDGNTETSSKATQILNTMAKSDFVIYLFMLKSLFSVALAIRKHLQKVDSDISEACSNVENIADFVKEWRSNAEQECYSIFSSAKYAGIGEHRNHHPSCLSTLSA